MTSLDRTFAALGDATRMAILTRLSDGEVPLADLAEPFDMSLTAVSKHVRVLNDAGLVSVTKRGRQRFCKLQPEPMMNAFEWLGDYRRFWEGQLDALGHYLAENDS